ncbi:MAG: glycosyltransferase family 1 protein [Planctomycetota bacterium]
MKIALLTDAWEPQVNGVVRTWQHVIEESEKLGHRFNVIHPGMFKTVGAPRYPEIRLAVWPYGKTYATLDAFRPDAIHIATEGPIGRAGRRYCLKRKLPFTTSYHTQFPHYLRAYFGVPKWATYKFIRWFHGKAEATLAPTKTVVDELHRHGLPKAKTWSRGVKTDVFRPLGEIGGDAAFVDRPRPIFLYAGRVAVEKNIEAFLKLDLPGTKAVVGDGPVREKLQKQFPGVHWAGYQFGEDLARHYASSDVFVFPSLTDTFGVVMLEANAAGLPVAAYPVTGPIDVVQQGVTGCLHEDLRQACLDAVKLNPDDCRQYALQNSWVRCAQIALETFATLPTPTPRSSPAPDTP